MKKIKRIEEKSIPDNNVFRVDKGAASKMIQRGMGIYKPDEEDEEEEEQQGEEKGEKGENEETTTTTTMTTNTETTNNVNKRKAQDGEAKTTVSKKKAKI